MKQFILIAITIFLSLTNGLAKEKKSLFCFDFGAGKAQKGWTKIDSSTLYSTEKGYGNSPSNINFYHSTWTTAANNDGISLQCEWKKWCNTNDIYWDGISNRSNC